MDEINDRAIVNITRTLPNTTNSLVDNTIDQSNVNPSLSFSNPTFGTNRE